MRLPRLLAAVALAAQSGAAVTAGKDARQRAELAAWAELAGLYDFALPPDPPAACKTCGALIDRRHLEAHRPCPRLEVDRLTLELAELRARLLEAAQLGKATAEGVAELADTVSELAEALQQHRGNGRPQ